MFKIMLCCFVGMFISMLVKKMWVVVDERGIFVEIDVFGVFEFDI